MRSWLAASMAALLLPACARNVSVGSVPAPAGTAVALTRAEATITPTDMHDRIAFLASDALRGRDTPSPGLESAARYVADQFRAFGLRPAGDSGTYIQRWTYRRRSIDPATAVLELHGAPGVLSAAYGQDYFIVPGPADSVTMPLVFAGTVPAAAGPLPAEARGHGLVFFVPGAQLGPQWQQGVMAGVMSAQQSGATGVLLILDPGVPAAIMGALAQATAGQSAPFPVAGVSYAKVQPYLGALGISPEEIAAPPATPPQLRPLPDVTMHIAVHATGREDYPPNVAAILPGSDPQLQDQYVVFSAHMDHVGVGAPDASGDSIYNGADDDASGTASVVEVAQAFASLPKAPARSIIFLAVSGEEKGLFGSAYFVQHPPVPLDRIVADLNLDMIGRNAPDTVVAIGQDYSSLGPLVQQIAQAHPELGLTVAPDLWPEERLFFRSDHYNFAKAGVAALFFTTGLHEDYHRPSDEVERIDADKAARIARLVFRLGDAVASNPTPPVWTEKGKQEVGIAKE